jgi:hypothetical protein
MTDTLTWNRLQTSHYEAQASSDVDTGVLYWAIMKTAERRWEIVSITTGWERRRHGAAYTLREAKEIVGNFHRADLALAR